MSTISWIGVFSRKRLRFSHTALFILLTTQTLLCAARPNINNPNPDGIQIRHVPAGRTNPDAKPLTGHLTKRNVGVIKETGELQSQTTTEPDDLSDEESTMLVDEVKDNTDTNAQPNKPEVSTNKYTISDSSLEGPPDDNYDYKDGEDDIDDEDETTKTYTEIKETTPTSTQKPTSTYSLSSMSSESDTDSAISPLTSSTVNTTSTTSKHDFSSELSGSSTQSNSENFADVILVSKSSSASIRRSSSDSIRRTISNFITIVPALLLFL